MTSTPTHVVVVGGGVMGASVAMHAAKRHVASVTVVEKGEVGHGMSGRSSALVRMHYSFAPEVRLALRSLASYRTWLEVTGRPRFLKATGFVRIAPAKEIDKLRANVEMQRELGVDVALLSTAELRSLEPDWAVDDVPLAAYEPGSGHGEGALAATDMMARARELGAVCRSGCAAMSIRTRGGRATGVETSDGFLGADAVVLATGPWTRRLIEAHFPSLPVTTEVHEVAIIRPPRPLRGHGCAFIDSSTRTYARREGADMLLVGDFGGHGSGDPDSFPQAANHASLVELLQRASRRIPLIESAAIVKTVTGVYDMTPDARPLVGPVPGVDGLYVVAGFSGMGFKLAPAIGEDVAAMLAAGEATGLDIAPFAVDRFNRDSAIHGPFEYDAE